MAATWSMLLEELLEMILSRLDLADHLRFSSVCKHWRSTADKNPAVNKPFCLVQSSNPMHLLRRLLSSFSITQWHRVKFVGIFEEWLILCITTNKFLPRDRDGKQQCQIWSQIILLHIGSKDAPILLPLLPQWVAKVDKVVLSSPPDTNKCHIVLKDCAGDLALYRPGDTAWTMLCNGRISDMAFCKNHLYTVHENGEVKVFDSRLSSSSTCCFKPYSPITHMVEAFGKVLLFSFTTSYTIVSEVVEIDPDKNPSISEAKDLNGNIVFLNRYCSICLPARDTPEFTPNNIYILPGYDSGMSFYSCSLDDKKLSLINGGDRYPIFFTLFKRYPFGKTVSMK